MNDQRLRAALAGAVAAVAGLVVVTGLLLVGSPSDARRQRFDDRRVADLRQISSSVDLFWTVTDELPATLGHLAGLGGVAEPPRDPESGAPYAYRVVDPGRYELCAEFARASVEPDVRSDDRFWVHTAGRQCFELAPTETERSPRARR